MFGNVRKMFGKCSENVRNMFGTCSELVWPLHQPPHPGPATPVPNIFRTFPNNSEHVPNIFLTLSGDSLARERAGERCTDTPTGDPPSAETESTASMPGAHVGKLQHWRVGGRAG